MCVGLSLSLGLSLRGVRGRECSRTKGSKRGGEKERETDSAREGWVGMLDLLHLPFGKLEKSAIQKQNTRERKEEQMEPAPGEIDGEGDR